ncbi:MAG: hypothetical protein ACK5PP_14595 [Acidimicrobiales bacterium]
MSWAAAADGGMMEHRHPGRRTDLDPEPAPAPAGPADRDEGRIDPVALARFEQGLAELAARERHRLGRRQLWTAHHWPEDYPERCVRIGGRWVCRRCAALYPLGILVAVVSAMGYPPWPESWDPWAIWLLSLPATMAYVGEAVGLFRYRARLQVAATLVTAVAFGRGLGYELTQRWSPEFWGPVAVFGGIWFAATIIGSRHRAGGSVPGVVHRAATATSSSSSVLK